MTLEMLPGAETRRHHRLKLPAAYTLVRLRRAGKRRYAWTGYAYDISASGMRFELDEFLEAGCDVEVRVTLPGYQHTTFDAAGRVVRMHDDADEPGPVRMAMTFGSFPTVDDSRALMRYLVDSGVRAAA
jgi:hypothetical protein